MFGFDIFGNVRLPSSEIWLTMSPCGVPDVYNYRKLEKVVMEIHSFITSEFCLS